MRKGSAAVLLFTLIFGAAGFLLRRHEAATVFDPLTGLAQRGAPVTLFLIMLTVLFTAIIIIIAVYVSRTYSVPGCYEDTFNTSSLSGLISYIPVCLMWNCGTIIYLVRLLNSGTLQSYDIYFVILSVLAAISVIFISIDLYQNSHSKSPYVLSVVPIVFLCYWLILLYRQNAANPVLLSFVYLMLALAASIMSFYYTAGFLYGKPAPGKAIVAYGGTIFLCSVSLADNPGIGIMLILGAIPAAAAIQLVLLLRGLEHK